MSEFSKNNLKNFIISENNTKRDEIFNKLNQLCIIIEKIIIYLYIILINKKNIDKQQFNILFNIFKKIYEVRDIKYPIHLEYFISNYILKFIINLNAKEFEFINNLFNNYNNNKNYNYNSNKKLFTIVYDFFKHTESDKIYKALSSIKINNEIIFLSPLIKKNKYIKIPNEIDSYEKKIYFMKLVFNSSYIITIDKLNKKKINFFKKVLSKKTWNNFVDIYENNGEINNNDEIMFCYCLGFFCDFDYNIFITTIALQIVEEQNKNKTTTLEDVKKSKDLFDLFEIYYIIRPERVLGLSANLSLSGEELGELFTKINKKIVNDININNFNINNFKINELDNLKSEIEILNKYNIDKILIIKNNEDSSKTYYNLAAINQFIENTNSKIDIINKKINSEGYKIPIINLASK